VEEGRCAFVAAQQPQHTYRSVAVPARTNHKRPWHRAGGFVAGRRRSAYHPQLPCPHSHREILLMKTSALFVLSVLFLFTLSFAAAEDAPKLIEGTGEGWVELGEKDFERVNGADDTWKFEEGVIKCSGKPTGVIRTAKQYKNFELVAEWRHLKA